VKTASRSQLWLDNPGDWAWPGRAAASETLLTPPPWVLAAPARLVPATGTFDHAGSRAIRIRLTRRGLLIAVLLGLLAAACCALALKWSLKLDGITAAPAASRTDAPATLAQSAAAASLPALVPVSHDRAGSAIDRASFSSPALAGRGSFLVYVPPGYSAAHRYPVLYLLHGQDGHATAFLEVGLQRTLDGLIARGAVPPMIAVMVQDRPTLENWQNVGRYHSADYVDEVQELVDRMLPTIADRAGRAIAGSSKGGFGAMHVALANPYRYGVVESWLGYFNNLGVALRADRPVIRRLGLHAFLYGAVGDLAAEPSEDPAFAAALQEAGAQAQSAIYPGNHSLTTVAEHLESMLLFVGSSLREEESRAAAETWSPRTTGLIGR
jgi:enterochelin esterase-like enzyme